METVTTLQELIASVADAARDLSVGTTTTAQAVANTLYAGGLAGRRPNHWQHSELFFAEPQATAAGLQGSQPFLVTGYADGLFTLDHAFGATGAPQGLDFYIVRNHGQGNPYRAYLRAIGRAMQNLGIHTTVELTGLVTSSGVYTYTIPPGLDTVYAVRFSSTTDATATPAELRPDQWSLGPSRTLNLTHELTVNYPWNITLSGRLWSAVPATLNGTIYADVDEIVDVATEYLFRTSNRPVDQAKGQNLQAERIKFKPIQAYPNEQRIPPAPLVQL